MYGDEAKVIPSKQRQNIPALSGFSILKTQCMVMCTYLVLLLDKTSAKFENKRHLQMDASKWTNPNYASLESLTE
jgi:hypothetical protein